jgi:potassium efflux system protein
MSAPIDAKGGRVDGRRIRARWRAHPGDCVIARRARLRRCSHVVLAFVALLLAGSARGQGAGAPPGATQGGSEVGTEAALPEDLRSKLAQLEAERAELASRAAEWAARSAEYARARGGAPERLRALEGEIEALRSRGAAQVPERASVAELEAALLGAEQDLSLARREATEVDAETSRRAERRRQVPELLGAAKQRLQSLEAAPAAPAGEDTRLVEARRSLADARRAATLREIDAHEQELASYDARGALLAKRLDRAQLRVAVEQARVEVLRVALSSGQQRDAERAAERARGLLEETAALAPAVQEVVRQLAEENARLAEQRLGAEGLVGRIDDVSRKLANAEESVARIEADRARIATKLEAAGLTGSVGLLLRKQRADTPDVGKYRRFIRMRQDLISAAQVRQIELREERRDLADVDGLIARAMDRVDPDHAPAERAAIESLLRDLLETKRGYLDALIADHETYFQKLVDFDAKQQELIEKTEALLRFIDERILWIPSGTALRPGLAAEIGNALAWLADPRHWTQLGRALGDALLATPLSNALLALGLLLFAALGGRVRARIAALGDEARQPSCVRYAPTAEALGQTLLLVPWLPGVAATLGWRIETSPEATQFARCLGGGVLAAALVWVTLELPRQLLRRGGLAEAHFAWPADAVARLRRVLGELVPVVVPLVLLVEVFELRAEDAWKESLGRLAFVLLMGVLAAFSHRALRRPQGAIAVIVGAVSPLRWRILHGVAVAVPVLLGAAALGGYYWTALRLAARTHWTLCFLLALLVVLRLSGRWSLLAQRRLATLRARELEAARATQGAEAPPAVAEREAGLDLAAVNAQTSRLLQGTALVAGFLGLWLIWAEVLPAAGILREVRLWSTTATVSVESLDATGRTRIASEARVVPITLADLLEAGVVVLLTLVLVRNLPGLLELSLFRRVGLGPGERYAYATILKYAVAVGGVALAAGAIGLSWSSIQWLVAAVGIGLGFGLQEIFANFVSGLIILFERPIRVGDTVTIGDHSGTVTRIRIRATWITGSDRKELIVPNKELVTGRLVNWSHTDTLLRVDVRVGVAYGTDVQRALALLREIALRNERVLREPRPDASFVGFGESSLTLELCAFSPDISSAGAIRHALHLAIDQAFRAAGIEIAFPQRDIHIRSLPPPPPAPASGN